MKKRLLVGVVLVVAALAVGSYALASTTTLKLTSSKTALKYDKKKLKAHAGMITIVMKNPSAIFQHDVAIKIKGKVHKSKLAAWRCVSCNGHWIRNAELKLQNAALRRDVRRLRADPSAIEAAARDELGLVKPGEIVIQIEKP